jgi:anthranilate synthase component 2
MLLVIDNYDSFTYNLVQHLGELGADVRVFRNDRITLDGIRRLRPERLVISPGPCTPDEAGISVAAVRAFAGEFPILGVCLGHQSIAQAFGGEIVRAGAVMHGKTSMIYHDGGGVYGGLPDPFEATRYHSLVVRPDSVPDCLTVTSWTQDETGAREEIMGLRHRSLPVEGVQFHPESILTRAGKDLLANFLRQNDRAA